MALSSLHFNMIMLVWLPVYKGIFGMHLFFVVFSCVGGGSDPHVSLTGRISHRFWRCSHRVQVPSQQNLGNFSAAESLGCDAVG